MLLATFAHAHEYQADALRIDHPWSRPTPPGTPIGVGYLVITNTGSANITLTGAETPRAARVSIHQTTMKDGMMKMQPVDGGLVIPAGTTVELKPHGHHLMLEQLNAPLAEGERLPLKLHFKGADTMDVELSVESLDEEPMGDKQSMDQEMDHSMH
ncbi:copper chaperone PCu(A)C [Marinobacter salinisoli]|uniref:Copper chaperone PCu(A)C n=2 Tax=Marinobacter salinisoli TaxID=2769486 RepID=A0ABX7N2B3_9GAMM|nr:copper chaperone PCu(A)C [Marinobacter salinisoli]